MPTTINISYFRSTNLHNNSASAHVCSPPRADCCSLVKKTFSTFDGLFTVLMFRSLPSSMFCTFSRDDTLAADSRTPSQFARWLTCPNWRLVRVPYVPPGVPVEALSAATEQVPASGWYPSPSDRAPSSYHKSSIPWDPSANGDL